MTNPLWNQPVERWKVRALALIALMGMSGIIYIATKPHIDVPPSLAGTTMAAVTALTLQNTKEDQS